MKVFRRIRIAVSGLLFAAILIPAILLSGVKYLGFEVYTVLSGSMEPVFHTGSVIYVKPQTAEKVSEGEAITFYLNDGTTVATHRVLEKDEEKQCFITKGDANNIPDAAPVSYEQLIGVPVFMIPYLGYAAVQLQTPAGMYAAVGAVLLLLFLMFLPDTFGRKQPPQKKLREQEDRDAREGCL